MKGTDLLALVMEKMALLSGPNPLQENLKNALVDTLDI